MEYRPAVGDPFVSNTSLKLLTVRVVTSFGFGALYNGYEIGKLPLRTFSTFLLEHVNILLPLCGTSIRPCHAVLRPLSHARMLEGRRHQAVSVGHRGRHERPCQALTQVRESPDGQRWLMVYGASPMSWKRNTVVPCSQYLAIHLCVVSSERDFV
jgi:hypothetical protein